jgi:hypothetical protein
MQSMTPRKTPGAALILAAALAAGHAPCGYAQDDRPMVARAQAHFQVVIPAFVRVKALQSPATLEITAGDVAQGFIDLDAATSVQVTSNGPGGYAASAVFDRDILSQVEVRMPHRGGVAVDETVRIGYRLHLNRGLGAGTYRWPVTLVFGAHSA